MNISDLEEAMHEAARKRRRVHIVTSDSEEYNGIACGYTKADDEDNGYATINVETADKGNWCLGTNEIKNFEVVN